jgi:hypothetical protein
MKNITQLMFRFSTKETIASIPHLKDFMQPKGKNNKPQIEGTPRFLIETYGCQMNVNDTEIVRSVLSKNYQETD